MRIVDRRIISRQVRIFIKAMPEGYKDDVPKDVLISEILSANEWFVQMPIPMEKIREEVEKQFNLFVS